jgi:hypothetical protein
LGLLFSRPLYKIYGGGYCSFTRRGYFSGGGDGLIELTAIGPDADPTSFLTYPDLLISTTFTSFELRICTYFLLLPHSYFFEILAVEFVYPVEV